MLVGFIASAKPYMAAEEVSGRVGYSSAGTQGSLNRQPIAVETRGTHIDLIDYRISNGQIRLHLDGDQTAWMVGKSLYIGSDEYSEATADFNTFSGGITQLGWSGPNPAIVDGKGYAVDVF